MLDLLVIVGAQLTVLLSMAAMNVYRLRTDVLTGPYIQSATDQSADAHMSVLTGQPQMEWPPGPGDGICSGESISTREPPLAEALLKDTAGSIGADDRPEPSSPMTSDLNAGASTVASRSSSQRTIRLDPTGHARMKIHT